MGTLTGRTRVRIRSGGRLRPSHHQRSNMTVGFIRALTPSPSSSGGSESPLWSKVWSKPTGTEVPLDPEGASKLGTTTGNQLASPSEAKSVSWGHTTKVHFFHDEPDGLGLPPPPGREGYLAKMAGKQSLEIEHASPPEPQSKGFISNFKTYFGKLGKLKFRPRFQRTVDTGA